MHGLRATIPSLNSLFAFEAAARHLSFSRAAAELNVTQAAISYAVKRLEDFIGTALFVRAHRRISLTENGERLYNDVAIGLGHIARTVETMRPAADRGHVTFSVSTAFATYWMLPRLARLRQDLPALDMRLQTTDRNLDLSAEGISLGLRQGDGDWPAYDSALFCDEEIIAVASPRYLDTAPPADKTGDLPAHRLIHLEEPFRPVPSWADWLAAHGVAYRLPAEELRLNDYALVLHAALDGEGIALGWRHLVADSLAAGTLVQVTRATYSTGNGFYLIWPRNRPLADAAREFRDWLLKEARAGEAWNDGRD